MTIAPQALFLMNHAFVIDAARDILARPEIDALANADTKIEWLYRLIYNRPPSDEDRSLAREFFDVRLAESNRWQSFAQALLMANEFVFVD
jgi:hypothetical protein